MPTIQILKSELDTDPLSRGYTTMTDEEATNDLNAAYRERNRGLMTGSEILNVIAMSEFNALDDVNKQLFWNVLHLGDVNPFGVEANLFILIFGAGSDTIIALKAARKENITRGEEIGFGLVRQGHVQLARS